MKLTLGGLLIISFAIFAFVQADFIIDSFQAQAGNGSGRDLISLNPAAIFTPGGAFLQGRNVDLSQYASRVFNNLTNSTVTYIPNIYYARNFYPNQATTYCFGGVRRIVLATVTAGLPAPQTSIGISIGAGQFSEAIGSDLTVGVTLNYVGDYRPTNENCSFNVPFNLLCPVQTTLGPLLNRSYDITENGIDGAVAFTIIFADRAGLPYTFTFFSNTTAAASKLIRSVAPGATGAKRDSEFYDEEVYSWDVPLAEPITFKNGKRATVGRRYVIPFTSFTRVAGYPQLADFTQIRGISIAVGAIQALDTVFQDIRTVPLVSLVKNATITETVTVDSVAQPGEIINYTLRVTVAAGLTETNVQNIFVYDYPGRNYGNTQYATFVANSLTLNAQLYNQINCSANSSDTSTCVTFFTNEPSNFNASIFTAANDPYFADRIAIIFPSIPSGSYVDISYQLLVPSLPCLMQTCANGCSFSTQPAITGGQCYCQQNQGRVCTAIARNNTVNAARAIDNSTNFNIGIAGCTPSTDGTAVTIQYLTVTPIGTVPNPALTIAANPTQKANGVFPGGNVTYTVTLTNNRTRSSDSFVVNLTPDASTVCAVGPNSINPNFTADATTGNPVYSVSGGLQYFQTITFSNTCTVRPDLACGVPNTTMAAAINFGANTVNCPELTAADNFGSDFVPVIGAASITLSKTSNNNITYGAGSSNVAQFTINYSNNGQRTASNVVITETVPAVLAQYYQASDNPSFVSVGGNNYSYTIPTLAAGQSSSVSFNFRVPPVQTDCTTGNYVNSVFSNSVCGASSITATAFVGVTAVPDMSVTISNAPSTVQPGATVCYTISYQNIGYRVAQSVVLSIVLPAFTTYSSTSTSGFTQVGSSSVYTLSVGDIQAQSAVSTAQFCVVANSNNVCTPSFSTNVNVTSVCQNFPETNLANNYANTSLTSIAGSITLTLTKTPQVGGVTVTAVNTSSTIVYSLSGANTGNTQAQNVTIVETLPSGVTLGSNNGFVAGSVAGQYSYFVGNVNAGSTFGPVLFSVVVPSTVPCPAPSISNSATVSETCTGATANASSTVAISAQPVLTLSASTPTSVTLVANGTNQVCVSATYGNTGTQTANSAVLTVTYNSLVTPVSGTNNGWVASNGVLTLNVGNINPGTSTTSPSACFTVPTPVACGVNITNFVFTLTSPCAINPASVSSPTYANIIASPVFTITKTNNIVGQAQPGASVTYTITYSNVGTQIANNVVLVEDLPNSISAGTNANFVCNGQLCTYNVGTLSPSQGTQTVTFVATISSSIGGLQSIVNNVNITAQPCSSYAAAQSTFVVAGFPNLLITKSDGGAIVTPGDYIYYTITYTNNGDAAALNTLITDIIPAFAKFNLSLSGAGWNCRDGAGAGQTCSINVGTVAPGQTGTVPLVVKTADWIRCGTNFTENYAYISTTVQESNYNDNNASVRTPIVGEPDLVISKMANRTNARRDRAGPGDLITYNITYTNVGVRDATNAMIYETVPEYTTYVASQSSAWSCADGSPAGTVCTFNTSNPFYPVMPGMDNMMAYGTLSFSVRVISNLPPEAHITSNCVSINNTCGECNPYDNMACYTVNLYGLPDLVLNQSAICRSVHWYLEWQNVGDQGASNVVVTDTVPAGTVFNPAASDSRWSCNTNAGSAQFGQCTLNVGEVPSGAGGSAVFVTNPQNGTTLTMFTNTGSVTGTGRNPDPTPENNRDTATVGFEGCPDACDSCCPVANECCPDKTEVLFNFRGILQGIDSCAAGSSS